MMLTQIIDEGTLMLYVGKGAYDMLAQAYAAQDVKLTDSYILLPGVMSRKKQVVPNISAVLD